MIYIRINPDTEITKTIRAKLKEDGGYCPCSLEKTPDTKCMCKSFRDQMVRGELGECHCGLYILERSPY